MFEWALLAMEAAGMVFDYEGNQKQKKINKMGLQLENQAINTNITMTRLQTEDASLASLQELRKTIGSQAAYFAASGGRANPAFGQQAISAQGQDERTRRLNQIGREAELRAQQQFAKLNYKSQNARLDQEFTNRVFNAIPFSAGFNFLNSGGSMPNSARSNASRASASSTSRGFGQKPYTG